MTDRTLPTAPAWLPGYLDDDAQAAVTRVYLALLQHPHPTAALLVAQGMSAPVVDFAITVLTRQGIIRGEDGGRWEVLSPDIALPAFAAELEREARTARGAAHELAQVYFAARSEARRPDSGIRLLDSLDEIHAASADAISSGLTRLRAFRAMSPRTTAIFEAPRHAHEEPSYGAGGVVLDLRTVYHHDVLSLPGALEVLEARARGGERYRFTGQVPFSAVIVDDTAAVVDLSAYDESGRGSLVVRSRPMVLALGRLADLLWDLATPMSSAAVTATARRDEAILALLAAGASDATIARQTGVSQRTVERRVRVLMDQVGASTRFQAGVRAARRGLL